MNTWHHVAFVYNQQEGYLYVDGNLVCNSTAQEKNLPSNQESSQPLHVGHVWCNDDKFSNFYIQDLRISKTVVYTDCFVPPSSFHYFEISEPNNPSCDELKLNIQSNTNNENDSITDISQNNHQISKNGNVIHSSNSVIGDSSLYFDGSTSNYLSIPYSSDWNLGSDDFTIDFWMYDTSSDVTNNVAILNNSLNVEDGTNKWGWIVYCVNNSVWMDYSLTGVAGTARRQFMANFFQN